MVVSGAPFQVSGGEVFSPTPWPACRVGIAALSVNAGLVICKVFGAARSANRLRALPARSADNSFPIIVVTRHFRRR